MTKLIPAALLSTLATFAVIPCSARAENPVGVEAVASAAVAPTPVKVSVGKNVYDASGKLLGSVYSVSAKGSPVVMLRGALVTVPLATLSMDKHKLVTSLSATDLLTKR